jgi:hypothetical protein
LRNEEFFSSYAFSSPNNIRVSKSRSLKWVRHVARIKEMRDAYKILVLNSEGKRPGGLGTDDEGIILK